MININNYIPKNVRKYVDFYNKNEYGVVPQDYIDFHNKVAQCDMFAQGFVILEDRGLKLSGNFDGMKYRELTIAHKNKNNNWVVDDIRWDDSGAWFIKGNGYTRFLEIKESTLNYLKRNFLMCF